ncbi:MAG: type II secretion system F family protein, partial [Halobacteriales archaeon]
DLVTAVQNARNTTPNENLEQFLDDMLGVLDSGGDLTSFLEEQTRTYRSKAEAEQSEFLEMLEVVSELFVVAFVAAPLFLVVTLVLVGMMGANAVPMTTALVYGVLPIGMVGFLVLVHYLSLPFSTVHGVNTRLGPDEAAVAPSPAAAAAERYDRYRLHAIRGLAADLLGDPVGTLRSHSPLLSLVVTVPAAAGLVVAVVASEPGDVAALYAADPVGATTGLVVAPLVVVAAPLSLLYELRRRRTTHIARRFPDTLNLLASANQMGIPLTEALDLVSRWSDGVIATELRKTHNDVQWSHDVQSALLGLGDRLGVPQVERTAKLLATGTYSTSDLSTVLSVAAEDTRTRYELERSRREEMQVYVLIVGIGFFVYLGVVVLLDLNYLTPVAQLSEQAASVEAATANAAPAMAVTEVPVSRYRTLFFHSALIQAAGSGLLAGKLAENDLLAGLKYAVALVVVAAAVFTVV